MSSKAILASEVSCNLHQQFFGLPLVLYSTNFEPNEYLWLRTASERPR
jgi:hypothetical protein